MQVCKTVYRLQVKNLIYLQGYFLKINKMTPGREAIK